MSTVNSIAGTAGTADNAGTHGTGSAHEALARDAFSDPKAAASLLKIIEHEARVLQSKHDSRINIMEVCGTHTVSIAKSGIRSLLPKSIRLISGPGCPVCVSSTADIDSIIALTALKGTTVTTFGDMIRVPGSSTSLMQCRARGASVTVVYSPLDALKLAMEDASRHIVFVGVGFETTTPLLAATILRAKAGGVQNFSMLTICKRVPPALAALVDDEQTSLDALILPGHVSSILGLAPYQFLASVHRIPGVVTGFEPLDILQGIAQILRQLVEGRPSIVNAYTRSVMDGGNPHALSAIEQVFSICDASWRGLGMIANSGYRIRDEFAAYDATKRFELDIEATKESPGCKCGDVLRGLISPNDCGLFAKVCTPANPVGPCMVSSEGSCAAYFRYQIRD